MNLVLGLLLAGGSSLAIWAGLTDPAGGMFAGLRNVLGGVPNTKHVSTTAAATTAAYLGGAAGASAAPAGYTPAASGARAAVIAAARGWLGVPYQWGGTSRAGVDCSGLVQQVYAAVGVHLPRVSEAQQLVGRAVGPAHAQAGDLVFFGAPAHHVGIYLGGGQLLHAPHTGTVVRTESVASVASSLPGSPVTYRDVLSGTAHAPAAHHHPAAVLSA